MTREEPSPRQLQVLRIYIEAGSRVAAAERLGLTEATVQNYLTIVRQVFGTSTSVQAFCVAVQRGLIDVNEIEIDRAA